MKAIALISAVIFIALTISAVVIIYQSGMPIVKRMQSAAVIDRMRGVFSELDEIIRKVASEGNGSRRTVFIRLDPGKLSVNSSQDSLYWEYQTDAMVISPRTSRRTGNLVFGSNLGTNSSVGDFSGTESYVLENGHIVAYIKKIGSPSSPQSYNTSELLLGVYNKDLNQWMPLDSLDISIDNMENSRSGQGYTTPEETGGNLPYATVSAWMDSSYMDYHINFTLESGADFLIISGSV